MAKGRGQVYSIDPTAGDQTSTDDVSIASLSPELGGARKTLGNFPARMREEEVEEARSASPRSGAGSVASSAMGPGMLGSGLGARESVSQEGEGKGSDEGMVERGNGFVASMAGMGEVHYPTSVSHVHSNARTAQNVPSPSETQNQRNADNVPIVRPSTPNHGAYVIGVDIPLTDGVTTQPDDPLSESAFEMHHSHSPAPHHQGSRSLSGRPGTPGREEAVVMEVGTGRDPEESEHGDAGGRGSHQRHGSTASSGGASIVAGLNDSISGNVINIQF